MLKSTHIFWVSKYIVGNPYVCVLYGKVKNYRYFCTKATWELLHLLSVKNISVGIDFQVIGYIHYHVLCTILHKIIFSVLQYVGGNLTRMFVSYLIVYVCRILVLARKYVCEFRYVFCMFSTVKYVDLRMLYVQQFF